MPRPPQWTAENASRFQDPSVVSAYHLRLAYPAEVFVRLRTLAVDPDLPVLDLGTGTGELARELAPHVHRVDAVDASATMVQRGKTLPGGDAPSLRWIVSRAEELSTDEAYGLAMAGDSLHWMDWDRLLPHLSTLLAPGGFLAIVHRVDRKPPWQQPLLELIAEYSTSKVYETFDLIAELERRGLFEVVGRFEVTAPPVQQSVDDYIESFHSRSSFSRDHMAPAAASEFDRRVRDLVEPWATGDGLTLQTVGSIVWGYPLDGAASLRS